MDSAMGSSAGLSGGTPVHTDARPQTHDSVHRNTKVISLRSLVSNVLFTFALTSKPYMCILIFAYYREHETEFGAF